MNDEVDEAAEAKRHITFSVPDDPSLLAAIGELSIRHVHVDYMLKIMIKNFSGMALQPARIGLMRVPSWKLRKRVMELARDKGLPSRETALLEGLIETCRTLTSKRNRIAHGLVGKELDGDHVMAGDVGAFGPMPTLTELQQWSGQLEALRITMVDFLHRCNLASHGASVLNAAKQTGTAAVDTMRHVGGRAENLDISVHPSVAESTYVGFFAGYELLLAHSRRRNHAARCKAR